MWLGFTLDLFISPLNIKYFIYSLSVDVVSLENSAVWETENKTFEMWICPLVHSLIGYCDDVILRYMIPTFRAIYMDF